MDLFSFEKLDTYNESLKLVEFVYRLAEKFPNHEKFGLYNQIHRAIASVPSNIAESSGRRSFKEKIHFIEIAYGSLMEAFSQLQIAQRVSYISEEELNQIRPFFFIVARMLTGLSKSYMNLLNP